MTRKILLIGGTGTISSSITNLLAKDPEIDLYVLNRGHKEVPSTVHQIVCDANDENAMTEALADHTFDSIADFVVYTPEEAEERVRVLNGKCQQYIFISTVTSFDHEDTVWLNEESSQNNSYSKYGQAKAECERIFHRAELTGFPLTIVRPSQTYGYDRIPLSVKGKTCWSVVSRIVRGKPVLIHGDGKTIWHMMHTFDFAYNFVQLITPSMVGKSINLVNPACVTWDMIYEEIGNQLNKQVKIVHLPTDLLSLSRTYPLQETIMGDKQYGNLYAKGEIEENIPDFACMIQYKKGITMYLDYVKSHPELQIADGEFDMWCDSVINDYVLFAKSFREKH